MTNRNFHLGEYKSFYQERLKEYLSWGRISNLRYHQDPCFFSEPISEWSKEGIRDWTDLNIKLYESAGFYIVEFIVPKYEELFGSLTDLDIEDGGFVSGKYVKDDINTYESILSAINEYFLSNKVLYDISPFDANNKNNLCPKDFSSDTFKYVFFQGEAMWSWRYPAEFKNKFPTLKVNDMNIYHLINDLMQT